MKCSISILNKLSQQPIFMSNNIFILMLGIILIFPACKSKPVMLEADTDIPDQEQAATINASPQDMHEIEVIDFQNIGKYTYLQVKERDRSFCVAIPLNSEIKKGNTYYYKGGLIMANPEKLKFNEKYETVFIVATLSENPLAANSPWMAPGAENSPPGAGLDGEIKEVKIEPAPGVVKLSELITNSARYDGKTIKVQGQCVKLNRMIMNKNWLHIQDHSVNPQGEKYDLTITTTEEVQLGAVVLFEGKIATNKDFGAGYKYQIILEDAKLK